MRAVHITCLLMLANLLLFTPSLAHADTQNKAILNIAIEDSWPPYADINGQGYSRDILERALALTHMDYAIQVEPYARSLYLTKTGLVNACLNVTKQESTEAVFYFGKEPLLIADAYFFVSSDNLREVPSLKDVPEHYRVGVITSYEYGDLFEAEKHRFSLSEVRTQEQLISMLKTGRLDAMIMFDEVYEYTRKEMALPQGLFRRAFLNHSSDIHVAFNKDDPQSKIYAEKLDTALRQLKTSRNTTIPAIE